MNVSPNHPTFSLTETVQNITHNFLNNVGLNYFQYLRCYANGSIGLLVNNTALLQFALNTHDMPVAFSSFKTEHAPLHSYWFLWDEELPSEPVKLARERFNFHNGLTLVRRSHYYYDMIAVATPVELSNAGAFYLNKLKHIEQFINVFDNQYINMIQTMDQHTIPVPEQRRDINYQKICLPQGRLSVQGQNGPTHITSQELACLRLLTLNYSHKEIANVLNVSPRSVETYINRVKLRTGLKTPKEIEHMLLMCT